MKKLYTSIVLTSLLLAFAVPSSAITLSFMPQNQTRLLGETAIVDVVVGGLTGSPDEIVSAFDLSLLYDQTIVQANAVTLSAISLMGGISDTLYDAEFNTGRIDFNVTSFLTDDNDIAALQAGNNDPFTLARIFFATVGLGTSPLSFDFTSPAKVIVGRGAMELPISPQNGSITVTNGQGQVPEPSALLLLVLGVFALAITGNRKLRFLA